MSAAIAIYFILLVGFVNTHQRHARHFRGESQGFLFALHLSTLLGTVFGLGFLVWYGVTVAWYWPLALFVIGGIAGGLLFGLLDALVGGLAISFVSFVGWPTCGYLLIASVRAAS